MKFDTEREAYEAIESRLKQINLLMNECTDIAEANAVIFESNVRESSGTYYPESLVNKMNDEDNSEWIPSRSGWLSSSDMC